MKPINNNYNEEIKMSIEDIIRKVIREELEAYHTDKPAEPKTELDYLDLPKKVEQEIVEELIEVVESTDSVVLEEAETEILEVTTVPVEREIITDNPGFMAAIRDFCNAEKIPAETVKALVKTIANCKCSQVPDADADDVFTAIIEKLG